MKKLVATLALMCAFLAGCGTPEVDGYREGTERFKVAISEGLNVVYVDTETGVMYFYHKNGYSGGLSVMLDADGNPLIWEG